MTGGDFRHQGRNTRIGTKCHCLSLTTLPFMRKLIYSILIIQNADLKVQSLIATKLIATCLYDVNNFMCNVMWYNAIGYVKCCDTPLFHLDQLEPSTEYETWVSLVLPQYCDDYWRRGLRTVFLAPFFSYLVQDQLNRCWNNELAICSQAKLSF
jgi:hypothetical protein